MMMRLTAIPVALALFITLNACCHQKKCNDADPILNVYLVDFQAQEIDTLLFSSFAKNSGFAAKIDSFFVSPLPGDTIAPRRVDLPSPLSIDRDWQVKIKSTGAVYSITDFVQKKNICNRCITGNSYYTSIESYRLNNIKVKANPLTIYK